MTFTNYRKIYESGDTVHVEADCVENGRTAYAILAKNCGNWKTRAAEKFALLKA